MSNLLRKYHRTHIYCRLFHKVLLIQKTLIEKKEKITKFKKILCKNQIYPLLIYFIYLYFFTSGLIFSIIIIISFKLKSTLILYNRLWHPKTIE